MNSLRKIAVAAIIASIAFAPVVFAEGKGEKAKDSAKDAKSIVMTFAHHLPPTTVQHKAVEIFAENIKKRSGGKITVNVAHSGQLGGQRELIEAVKMGTIDMALGESGRYEAYVPEFGVFSLPFMFKDLDDYHQTVDGAIGAEFTKLLKEKAGMEILAWVDGGVRNVFIKKEPSSAVSSMNGVKIRTPESAMYVNTFKALGANPTPIAAPEMYSAIQSGVVDAMEGSYETAFTYKIFEVAKFCLETGHINTDVSWVINAKAIQKLPADLQQAIRDAAKDAAIWQRGEFSKANEEYKAKLAGGGMKIIKSDHAEFLKAVAPVYKNYVDAKPQAAEILKKMGKL
ncbi:MAG: TRAP transporter substrate-binding protein [Treponemataceae bacterium]